MEEALRLWEDFMKKGFQSFSFVLTLTVLMGMITWAGRLNAQDTTPQTQQPMPETQQPPQQQVPTQAPDQTAPSPSAPATEPSSTAPTTSTPSSEASAQTDTAAGQTFTGTIVKQGDKYVLQDAASGTTYDIDHQDEVKKFEGKKVRVHGTLDSSGKMIHVQ
jgi:cytoskeletal protein RodZ